MKHRSLKLLSAAVFGLSAACSSHHDATVQPLSAKTQAQVTQNLQNGRVPAPAEVAAAKVPAADDACKKFQATIPADWIQGKLTVPEDPANPNGQQIHVFYYGKLTLGSTPAIFYNGGPGADSHGSVYYVSRMDQMVDPKKVLSFIYVDQRGNGCSDFYPQGTTPDVLQRLSNYGSRGIVSDSEKIRAAIWPGKPWIIFGQSYGGFIVHRYATIAPQGVKAAFSHANVISPDGYVRLRERIASQVRVGEMYFKDFPDDRKLLQNLKADLPLSKCFVSAKDATRKACGYAPLQEMVSGLLGFNDQWMTIHKWINVMATPSGISDDGVSQFLATFYFTTVNPLNSQAMAGRVIGWVDRSEPSADIANCTNIRTDLAMTGIDLNQSLMNECMTSLQWEDQYHSPPTDSNKAVEFLKKDQLTIPDFVTSLKANPALQFYAYSGQKDTYVPVENFAPEVSAAESLVNFHYTNFSGTGHDGFYDEPSLWQNMVSEASR